MADAPKAVSRHPGPGGIHVSALTKGSLVLLSAAATSAPTGTPAPAAVPPNALQSAADSAGSYAGSQILKFQYNPESITRTRAGVWDYRKVKKGNKEEVVASTVERNLQDSYRGGGLFVKSETITMKLIFDATEALLAGFDPSGDLGVLPELAVLEQISFGSDSRREEEGSDAKKAREAGKVDGKKPKSPLLPVFPTECLLVLGSRRFPVVVTALTINEKRFNEKLTPIRAEVDVSMRILESGEIQTNSPTLLAFNAILKQRQANAAIGGTAEGTDVSAILDALVKDGGPPPPEGSA
ncbi:MAG TPA: hypothetical protein PLA94_22450 [Myxococcota bacterium]|nr:hypothetical protein [Myxococcota bacterium]HND32781.1 hypothetical protein [Myxococcota bacterium]